MRVECRLALAGIVLSSARVAFADPSPAVALERIRSSLLHLAQAADPGSNRIEQWLGTGFVIDSTCTFATARHVLDLADRQRIIVRHLTAADRSKARTLTATVLWEDPEHDLAYLRFKLPDGKTCADDELRPLPLVSRFDPRALGGEAVRVAGFPRLGPYDVDLPILRAGIVASAEGTDTGGQPLILLDLAGVP